MQTVQTNKKKNEPDRNNFYNIFCNDKRTSLKRFWLWFFWWFSITVVVVEGYDGQLKIIEFNCDTFSAEGKEIGKLEI